MVLMGDFSQLPPVKYKGMFEVRNNCMWYAQPNNIMQSHFSILLEENVHKTIKTWKEFVSSIYKSSAI